MKSYTFLGLLLKENYVYIQMPNLQWEVSDNKGCETTEISIIDSYNQDECIKISTRYIDPSKSCNGEWSSWKTDADCSKTCGGGYQVTLTLLVTCFYELTKMVVDTEMYT